MRENEATANTVARVMGQQTMDFFQWSNGDPHHMRGKSKKSIMKVPFKAWYAM